MRKCPVADLSEDDDVDDGEYADFFY